VPHLIVLAKEPRPGLVKTRLAKGLGDLVAARLFEAFLLDTLEVCRAACRASGASLCVSYSPASAADYFQELAPDALLMPQPDGDLGARLAAAVEFVWDRGADGAVLVGSDLPHLEQADLQLALDALASAGAVLGPSCDGGYWLLGLSRPAPGVFEAIDWSTARVLEQTRERLEREGFEVVELPTLFDIDDAADLERLRAVLEHASPERCPRTRSVLSVLDADPGD